MKEKQTQFNCPVEATLSLIGGKYKPLILWTDWMCKVLVVGNDKIPRLCTYT